MVRCLFGEVRINHACSGMQRSGDARGDCLIGCPTKL